MQTAVSFTQQLKNELFDLSMAHLQQIAEEVGVENFDTILDRQQLITEIIHLELHAFSH